MVLLPEKKMTETIRRWTCKQRGEVNLTDDSTKAEPMTRARQKSGELANGLGGSHRRAGPTTADARQVWRQSGPGEELRKSTTQEGEGANDNRKHINTNRRKQK